MSIIVWVCPDCDQESPTFADFCSNCGKPRPVIAQYRQHEPPKPKPSRSSAAARAVLLLSGLLMLGLWVPDGWFIGFAVYLMICAGYVKFR